MLGKAVISSSCRNNWVTVCCRGWPPVKIGLTDDWVKSTQLTSTSCSILTLLCDGYEQYTQCDAGGPWWRWNLCTGEHR